MTCRTCKGSGVVDEVSYHPAYGVWHAQEIWTMYRCQECGGAGEVEEEPEDE